jgi:hypothetical protein
MKKIIFITLLFSGAFVANAQSDSLPQPPLEDFIGKYVFPEGSPVPDVDVVVSSGVLSMTSAAGSSTCTRLGADSFFIDQFSGYAVFKRAEDKKVNAVHIEAGGYVLDGQKQNTGAWIFSYSYGPVNREMLPGKK